MHVVYLANYLGLNCPKQALNRMGRADKFPLKLLIFVGTSPNG